MANAHSQDTPPNLIPPSPTAYAFAKYGDVPVSLATGIPNISIPICRLTDHGIGTDVFLSYYAGGIKVDEEATNVGLGWSLNNGGTITRVIQGRADDLFNGVFQPRTDIPMGQPADDYTLPTFITQHGVQAAAHNGTDNGPDLFIFNFNGRTGKFCFDKNGNVVMLKKEDLDIRWQQGPTGYGLEFIIKDEKGITYEFAQYETTYVATSLSTAISTWYLTKIISPTNNTITFEYNSWYGGHYNNNSIPEFIKLSNTHEAIARATGNAANPAYVLSSRDEMHIHKISCSTGSVEFTYDTQNRQDTYLSDHALTEVAVYDPSHILINKFKFNTSYFEANDSRKYPSSLALFQHLNKRLRLDGIQGLGADGLTPTAPPYYFTYLGDNDPATDDSYTLPVRLSPQQDHWGYYNYSGNTILFPSAVNFPAPAAQYNGNTSNYNITVTGGADRSPDTAAMKADMIQRITYPTGGHTDFLFEANYSANYKEGGVRIKTITDYPVVGIPKQKNYTYDGYSYADPDKHYYELYHVDYNQSDDSNPPPYYQVIPNPPILDILGVPYDINSMYHTQWDDWVKISAQSQSVLGRGSNPGYDMVRVSEPGNGYMTSSYDNFAYPDYNGDDPYNEGTSTELGLLNGMFQATEAGSVFQWSTYVNLVNGFSLTWRDWPYVPIFDNSWKRGVESQRNYYRENGTLVKSEAYDYSRKLLNVVPGYMVYDLNPATSLAYFWAVYGVPGGQILLNSKTETTYDANGQNPVNNITNYYYDNPAHLQASRVETIRSDSKKEVTQTSYPLDYLAGTTFIDNMVNSHLVDYPVEQVSYQDDGINKKILSGTTTYYQGGNGLIDHANTLLKTGNLDAGSYKFSNRAIGVVPSDATTGIGFLPDSRYELRLKFYGYDNQGNLKNVGKTAGTKINFVWGYGGQYPIAQVINADYSTIETLLGGATAVQNFRNITNPTDAAVNTFLASLRIPANLPGAQMTTYTYKPLVGITSVTDAKGQTTYYEYDSFQRLQNVKDQYGNILKNYCYNYAGQATGCAVPVQNCGSNWQNTATTIRCKLNTSNQNTGEQEQEQRDMTVCSSTYNQIRWVVVGTNTTSCPVPAVCDGSNCYGVDKRCVDGNCQTGTKIYTSSVKTHGSLWTCTFHYLWTDGAVSEDYTEDSSTRCVSQVD